MAHPANAVKFNCMQISEMLTVLEKYGMTTEVIDDATASQMFSELLITTARELDSEQAEAYHNAV